MELSRSNTTSKLQIHIPHFYPKDFLWTGAALECDLDYFAKCLISATFVRLFVFFLGEHNLAVGFVGLFDSTHRRAGDEVCFDGVIKSRPQGAVCTGFGPLGPMGVGMKPRFDIMRLQYVDERFAVDFTND